MKRKIVFLTLSLFSLSSFADRYDGLWLKKPTMEDYASVPEPTSLEENQYLIVKDPSKYLPTLEKNTVVDGDIKEAERLVCKPKEKKYLIRYVTYDGASPAVRISKSSLFLSSDTFSTATPNLRKSALVACLPQKPDKVFIRMDVGPL